MQADKKGFAKAHPHKNNNSKILILEKAFMSNGFGASMA